MTETRSLPRSGVILRRIVLGITVAVLLLAHWLLATGSAARKSMAFDEIHHLTAGYSYWKLDDYRLHTCNGNLSQRWLTIPLALSADLQFPTLQQPFWERSDVIALGYQFLYGSGNDEHTMLTRSRAFASLLSVAVCLVVFLWSREIFGWPGALLSLGLVAISPTILAHGRLVTSDICVTLFLTLGLWLVWKILHEVTWMRVALLCVSIGCLFLSKYSAVVILPTALILMVIVLWRRRRLRVRLAGRRYSIRSRPRCLAVHGAVALLVALFTVGMIWAAFGGQYSPFRANPSTATQYDVHPTLEDACTKAGAVGTLIRWCASRRLLPEAYLHGAAYVFAEEEREAFLNGDYSMTGWRHYFPYAVLVKTPLPLFGLLMLGLLFASSGRSRRLIRARYLLVPLLVFFLVYGTFSVFNKLNIGHRHVLPLYPCMFIAAGAAAGWLGGKQRLLGRLATIGFVAWFAAEGARAYPDYLAYFNQLVDRRAAYRHLVDSNLDWGQDLPALQRYLSTRRPGDDRPVYLAYFGSANPAYYGIDARWIPVAVWIPNDRNHDRMSPLQGGTYCVSATALQSVYSLFPGRWNQDYEDQYRRIRPLIGQLDSLSADPDSGVSESKARELRQWHAHLSAARLSAFLRQREPDDRAGFSILIYELTDDDVSEALFGSPVELDDTSWPQRELLRRTRQRGPR